MNDNWRRVAGVSALAAYLVYLSFLLSNLNTEYILLTSVYVLYNIVVVFLSGMFVINSWTTKVPVPRLVVKNHPRVGIIIPTWKEPLYILENTIISVLEQDYPTHKMVIVISDDDSNDQIAQMIQGLSMEYNGARIIYHVPPSKSDPVRRGEGKAGNLNSAYQLLLKDESIRFIETRDADDLVGTPTFLNQTVGQLLNSPNMAFIQTNKDAIITIKDVFDNRAQFFYRSVKLFKNGANSVFPCGSGLLWRREALEDIGGFPYWSLVEDFQSGYEALSRGWEGGYIPIRGAISQAPPEDIPNVYKQRGVWALDSLKFLIWGRKSGLTLRQKLHFMEPGLIYIYSAVTYIYAYIISAMLAFGIGPITNQTVESTIYHFTWLLGLFLFLSGQALVGGLGFSDILQTIRSIFSLGPLHVISVIKVLAYGKNGNPRYRVTRKTVKKGFYFFQILPQLIIIIVSTLAVVTHVYNVILGNYTLDLGNSTWALIFIYIYFGPVSGMFRLLFTRYE